MPGPGRVRASCPRRLTVTLRPRAEPGGRSVGNARRRRSRRQAGGSAERNAWSTAAVQGTLRSGQRGELSGKDLLLTQHMSNWIGTRLPPIGTDHGSKRTVMGARQDVSGLP